MVLINTYENQCDAEYSLSKLKGEKRLASERDDNGVSLEIGNFCTLSALFNQSWFVRG